MTMTHSKECTKKQVLAITKTAKSKNGDAALKINRYCCADDEYKVATQNFLAGNDVMVATLNV